MSNLLVVLQTHSLGDSQHYLKMHDMKRYCGADKPEVMRRCTLSLIESLNYAKNTLAGLEIELQVFDDHSDEESLKYLTYNLSKAQFKTNLTHLETKGIVPSILKCYQHGKEFGKDWVYFVQDDYLYKPNSIEEMLVAINQFSANINAPASIYPFNDPYKYIAENTVIQSHLVRTNKRHWKTHIHTASCFMTHKLVLDKEWDLFEKMGTSEVTGVMERDSINRLFYERGYYLFVPIPSLALHMQYSTEEDPFINWREWWDRYPASEKIDLKSDQKTVLNVGSGGSTIENSIFAEDLHGLRELRLDISNKYNPDICADITNLSGVNDEMFDVVYTSHMIEHLDYFKVIPVIKDFLRITKSGGTVRIVVPNLKSIAAEIAKGNLLDSIYISAGGPISPIDMLFGHRASVLRGDEPMRHKTGFTKETFEKMFAEAAINNFTVEERGFDLLVNITKTTVQKKRLAA